MFRDTRLIVGLLALVFGLLCFADGWRVLGLTILTVAFSLTTLYIALVVWPTRIRKGSVLVIRLTGAIRELGVPPIFQRLAGRVTPSLYELSTVFDFCANDSRVKAVLVELADLNVGLAAAHELGSALRRLSEHGKRTVALLSGDSIGVQEYLIAAGASEIVANPNLTLAMLGVASGSFFLKRALDRLEVQAQVLQWKEYKGVGETFTSDRMSPALRDSLERLVQDWKEVLVECVSKWRGINNDQARGLLEKGFLSASSARSLGLIDRIGHFEDLQRELTDDDKKFVVVDTYFRRARYFSSLRRGARLALIYGVGPIVTGEVSAGDFIDGEEMASALEHASKDSSIAAIVLRIDSPGGSAVAADTVWRAIKAARERNKPVIVSMGNVAASGGYYIACAADAVVADPATISGSIGVVYAKFSLGKFLARLGIDFDLVKTAEISDALSIVRALSTQELSQLDSVMGELYNNFTQRVAQARGLSYAQAEEVARGRVWSGLAAKACGLVDEIGGLTRAIELAREKAGLSPEKPYRHVLYYPSPWRLRLSLGVPLRPLSLPLENSLTPILGPYTSWIPALTKLLSHNTPLLLGLLF